MGESLATASSRRRHLAGVMLWATVGAGALLLACTLLSVAETGVWLRLAPFLALSVIVHLIVVRVYDNDRASITISFGALANMATMVALPSCAPVVSFVGALAYLALHPPHAWNKALFNLANPVLASAVGALVYVVLAPPGADFTLQHLAVSLVMVAASQLTNLGAISLMVSLHTGQPLASVTREYTWSMPAHLLLGMTGAFLGGAHQQLGPVGTTMFALPVLILWFSATKGQQAIEAVRHQAQHDQLTELPNRSLLLSRLDTALATHTSRERGLGLLMLDLDRFKEINDTFGHDYGDLVLRQIGARLQPVLPSSALIARLGGDEFGVLLLDTTARHASQVAEHILRQFREPFDVMGHRLELGTSIGIAIGPDHGQDAVTLLRHADVAMYVAKHERTGYVVYSPSRDEYSPDRLALIGELRDAIEQNQLILYYQPKVATRTGRATSVEALLRWIHPERGLIPPDQFVPLAEHTGLIEPLTRWVVRAALTQCRAWLDAGHELPIAVNVSVHDLRDPSFPDQVAALLAASHVPPRCLRLEVTEGAIMTDPAQALDVLARLRALGVGASVDDFGTGYSSLAYLEQLPVDELKIDRSFLQEVASNEKRAAIVRSTIALGHELAMEVVAEGVEDQAAWELLGSWGCDLAQGYFLGRPASAEDVIRWLSPSAASSTALAA